MGWLSSVKKVALVVFCVCIILNALILHFPVIHYKTFYKIVKIMENDTYFARNILYKTYQDLKKMRILENKAVPLPTQEFKEYINIYDFVIFTSFIPSNKRYVVYNNTKYNWPSLGHNMKAVLFTNSSEHREEFSKAGWDVLPIVHVSTSGTPILKFMYMEVAKRYKSNFIGFSNADILFTDSLAKTLAVLRSYFLFNKPHVMISGRRTNVKNITAKEARNFTSLTKVSKKRGILFRADAEDYFFTDRLYPWEGEPDLVIGRIAYDNFLLLHSRMLNISTVDATQTVMASHQSVDKGHLEEKWKTTKQELNYNKYMIQKLFRKVNYYAGMTNCLAFETRSTKQSIIVYKRSKFVKYCPFRTESVRLKVPIKDVAISIRSLKRKML